MSGDAVRRIGETAGKAAVEVAWAQWSALAPAAASAPDVRARSVVDPEALVLLSLAFRTRERRLDDLLAGWARVGAPLLGVARINALVAAWPGEVREGLGGFARAAVDAGDRRWKRLAAPVALPSRGKDAGPLRLDDAAALLLRLRAGLGVGSRADLLALLLGMRGEPVSARTMAAALGYSGRAIRTAAEGMALAGLIEEVPGPPAAYRVDAGRWAGVLRTARGDFPRWRFWSLVLPFLAAVDAWAGKTAREGWSDYVASSRARDLVERHAPGLRLAGLAPPRGARGAEYLGCFAEAVGRVAEWSGEVV